LLDMPPQPFNISSSAAASGTHPLFSTSATAVLTLSSVTAGSGAGSAGGGVCIEGTSGIDDNSASEKNIFFTKGPFVIV
jgi:hypothetical protein